MIRVEGAPETLIPTVRRALEPVTPASAFVTLRPVRESVERVLRPWRLGATMFVC